MKKFFKKFIFLLVFLFSIFAYADNNTSITVYNSYNVGVKVETKCDCKNGIYKYYSIITIKKNSSEIIKVPHGMKKCEIWVLDVYIFSNPKK